MIRRGRLWPPGVRAQLTVGYIVVFSGLLIITYLVLALVARNIVFRDPTYGQLDARANQIAQAISATNGIVTLDTATGLFPPAPVSGPGVANPPFTAAQLSVTPAANVETDPIIRVLSLQNTPIYASPAFRQVLIPDTFGQDAAGGAKFNRVLTTSQGVPVNLLVLPLVQNHQRIAVLEVGLAFNTAFNSASERTVVIIVALMLPVILLAGAFFSYWLAGRAFRPIRQVANAARKIEAGDLRQRVPIPPARDDVRDLAITFNEMIARIEAAFAQQRRFVADASHELRTPVAAIRGLTDVALAGTADAASYEEALRNVNAEAERLSRLINDLLTLARADEGQLALEHEPVRLDLLAGDVAATLEPLAQERGISLTCAALEPLTVRGDTTRLIQIVMTLVDNALTYTSPGGLVTIAVAAAPGHMATLTITDTGIGIGPEDLPHIFERFYRADRARSYTHEGNGLGLSLARGLVRAHGGEIAVRSAPGQGTSFTVSLPQAPA